MKSEKEKMLSGQYYDASDQELVRERNYAKERLFEFNHTRPKEIAQRQEMLSQLIKTKGSFHVEAPFYCDYGYNIELGENFYANHGCIILDVNRVHIGKDVLFGPYVQVYTATHPVDPWERSTGVEYAQPIFIGNNVWIGGGAILCPGVKIGDHVTIGAGSVVTKDIPSSVVAAGNPCEVLKRI